MKLIGLLDNVRSSLFSRPDLLPEGSAGRFAREALERHKREGMELAFRARLVALSIFAIMIPITTENLVSALYYETLIILLVIVGWLQKRAAKVGRSNLELMLIFADILIFTVAIVVSNPLRPLDWPIPMQFRQESFMYFYVFLAFGTLAYSWRTVRGIGSMTVLTWTVAVVLVWQTSTPDLELSAAASAAFGHSRAMLAYMDPNNLLPWIRIQEAVAFFVVAWVLSLTVRRFSSLLIEQAELERERTNLARYFSPNVVEELSNNDEPLKHIRSQNIAVMFADIVGFTGFAAGRHPEEVIQTLRAFHQRMETEVFRHQGTLDKFLGDGLMATFGTPTTGEIDASNALACARAMSDAMDTWNAERIGQGDQPIHLSIGLHYGPVVLGDIGANRLEFAVIGDTVNVASRVEALTRQLKIKIAATDAIIKRVKEESAHGEDPGADFAQHGSHPIRGQKREFEIWGWI